MPKLTIVIPAKNEEKHLPKLLENISRQTFKDFEIIVADAASGDRTREVALAYGAKVVEGGMPGPGRNRGAEHAEGDTILFLDADVALFSEEFLDVCLDEMEERQLNIATCRVKPVSRKPIDLALHEAYNAYAIATEKIRPHAPGFCIFVKKDTHRDIDGFDEEVVFAEDHDYVQRAAKKGFQFGVLRSRPIGVSVRRLDKDGRLNVALKYVYSEFHMLAKGTFKNGMPFSYEMGG
ncbi:glycosyltransferase, partial [Patescibacteria group bacterium]|nr:glycosyltransferase [Patescibacteria group bacterium]MBU1629669.1 glycosyltransferase [Patescibacteria group bacterium]